MNHPKQLSVEQGTQEAAVNSGQAKAPRKTIKEIEAILCEFAPAVFNKEKPVPLRIGISKVLNKASEDGLLSLDRTEIKRVLSVFCSRSRYYRVMLEGAKRYDLDGSENGVVLQEQADGALIKLVEKEQERKALAKKSHAAGVNAAEALDV